MSSKFNNLPLEMIDKITYYLPIQKLYDLAWIDPRINQTTRAVLLSDYIKVERYVKYPLTYLFSICNDGSVKLLHDVFKYIPKHKPLIDSLILHCRTDTDNMGKLFKMWDALHDIIQVVPEIEKHDVTFSIMRNDVENLDIIIRKYKSRLDDLINLGMITLPRHITFGKDAYVMIKQLYPQWEGVNISKTIELAVKNADFDTIGTIFRSTSVLQIIKALNYLDEARIQLPIQVLLYLVNNKIRPYIFTEDYIANFNVAGIDCSIDVEILIRDYNPSVKILRYLMRRYITCRYNTHVKKLMNYGYIPVMDNLFMLLKCENDNIIECIVDGSDHLLGEFVAQYKREIINSRYLYCYLAITKNITTLDNVYN